MANSVFNYRDYKVYLAEILPATGASRGSRARLAQHLGCGTSFISQVLKGSGHFSLEQAIEINRFLGHTEAESHFFMLLIHHGRAGSVSLEKYYEEQIRKVLAEREALQNRLEVKRSLSAADQAIYYSEWYYAAIHVLISIPSLRTRAAIAKHLNLKPSTVSDCLDFLASLGLVRQNGEKFFVGENRIHISSKSHWISQHHANWRLRSLAAMSEKNKESLHFTSILAVSETDAQEIRAVLLRSLEDTEKIIQPSSEEAAFCLGLDFFRIG